MLLKVNIVEVSRSNMDRMGINLASAINDTFFAFTNLGGGAPFVGNLKPNIPGLTLNNDGNPLGVGANNNFILGAPNRHLIGFIDALKQNGLGKVLAEPTLMAASGQEASFLAGGEFPIPIPQGGGSSGITVEYKKFGVQLRFTPTVLQSGKISLKVAPEVSDVDFATAVQVGGFVVPGIKVRSAAATVELEDEHTLAIAGLLREDTRRNISKFPVLGSIPILGALFRSTQFQKSETELLILVTPQRVKGRGTKERIALPTDRYPAYEQELLEGRVTDKKKVPLLPGGFDGALGHTQ